MKLKPKQLVVTTQEIRYRIRKYGYAAKTIPLGHHGTVLKVKDDLCLVMFGSDDPVEIWCSEREVTRP